MSILNDDSLFNGQYRGYWSSSIDENSRLRLNKGIFATTPLCRGESLWRYADPAGKCFVLCPDPYRKAFSDYSKAKFNDQESEIIEKAERLLACGNAGRIDSYGRIIIPGICLSEATIKVPRHVQIFGNGLWFEVTK